MPIRFLEILTDVKPFQPHISPVEFLNIFFSILRLFVYSGLHVLWRSGIRPVQKEAEF